MNIFLLYSATVKKCNDKGLIICKTNLNVVIFDVDGVLTTGQFFYSETGKVFKVFGPDDNDALSLLKSHIEIRFITGDKKGFPISKKRIVDDMNFPLDLVSTIHRMEWISARYEPRSVIYMGDGIFDHHVMKQVGYSIAPKNSDPNAIFHSDFVTKRSGGNRAVAEACLHIMSKFFYPYDPNSIPNDNTKLSDWTV